MALTSNIFINNIPEIQEREFKYRSKISSHQLNELQDEAFKDLLDLFNRSNKLQKAVYEMQQIASIENKVYSEMLNQSQYNLNSVIEKFVNYDLLANEFHYLTQYGYQAFNKDEDYPSVIGDSTNDVTAGIVSSVSKTRMYDATYDETLIPPTLQIYVGPDSFRVGGNILSIEDSDIENAFDGSNATVWFRKVSTTTDVDYIENEVVIALPENIITTRQVNEIIIKPFPAGWMDIMDIRYKANGAWQTIPGFTEHYGCAMEEYNDIFGNLYNREVIMDAPDLKFNFKDIETNQIKIKLRQRHFDYDAENNRRIWYLGLRDVDIIYNTYTRDHSEFCMNFNFPEEEHRIKVYDTDIYFNNSENTNDPNFGVSKEYFYYDPNGNAHKISDTCPFILEGHRMMIRFTIDGIQNTPNIHMAKVKYKLE